MKLQVKKQVLTITMREVLVSGSVNIYKAEFAFDSTWDGYNKIAVFKTKIKDKADTVCREVALTENACVIPWEVLAGAGKLKIGVYGVREDKRLPTIYTDDEIVLDGAAESCKGAEPTPQLYEQLLSKVGDLAALKTKDKSSLVAAINEIWASGGSGSGASVTDAAINEDGHLIITLSTGKAIDAGYAVGPAGADGKDGAPGQAGHPGPAGADGVGIQSIVQTTTSTEDGGTNVITVTKTDGTSSTFAVLNGSRGSTGPAGADGQPGADGKDGITPTIGANGNWYLGDNDTGKPSRGETGPAGADGKDGAPGAAGADGYTPVKGMDYFTEAEKQEIAEEAAGMVSIPATLPNPNALTFTGAVTGSYDGSAPLEVSIPSGGGGTGGGGDVFELIGEATSSGVSDASGLTIPFDGSLYKTIIAYAYNLPAGNNKRIIIRTKKAWYDGYPMGWNTVIDTYLASLTNMNHTWGFFGAAIDVGGKLFTLGAAESNTNGGHGFFRFYPQNGAIPTLSLSGCKFISLDCNSSSEMLPDGCSLIVWGVRK